MLKDKAESLYRRVLATEKMPMMQRAIAAGSLAKESAALLMHLARAIENLESETGLNITGKNYNGE